ncbi:MAG: hypothetical protein PF436_14225 [Prolixibacteraceae bacterium]|nr:hypothetical protein [Prolixibacteraceae bacterium]
MRQIITTIILISSVLWVSGQTDTTYYFGPNGSISDANSLRVKKTINDKHFFFTDSIKNQIVREGITPQINEIVINAFRNLEGEWKPAVLNDEKVRFFQTFPITFSNLEYQVEFFDFYSGLVKFEQK